MAPREVPSLEARERAALADLAAGRFRKARDAFKQLAKEDRERFLPRLIESNAGLAGEMIAKGQASEAEQVMAYLKTIAPPETVASLQIPLAVAAEDWERATRLAAAALDAGQADAVAGSIRLSDALVLAGNLPTAFSGGEAPAWREDFERILAALRAVGEERFGESGECLRPVGRQSLFAEWKLLIRGLLAFYEGERERAEKFFATLDPLGVPGKAARPFVDLLGDSAARRGLSEVRLALIGEALGLTEREAAALAAGEQAWNSGKPVLAYKAVRAMGGDFPSNKIGWQAALGEFFVTASLSIKERNRADYLEFFERMLADGTQRNPAEGMLAARVLAGDISEDGVPPGSVWDCYARFCEEELGPCPKLQSRAWAAAGTAYATILPPVLFMYGPEMRDGELAEAYLLKAVKADETNFQAHSKLLEVYEYRGDESARNKLLDRMVKRFPREKSVLLRAGTLCVQRKAFKKGVDFLERARELDPLDGTVAAEVLRGYYVTARHFYGKGELERGREAIRAAEKLTERGGVDPDRGRAFLLAREGVLEELFGDKKLGLARQEEALAEARTPLVARFFTAGVKLVYGNIRGLVRDVRAIRNDLRKAIRGEATVGACLEIWPLVLYLRALAGRGSEDMEEIDTWFSDCLKAARTRPVTRDEVVRLGNFCGPEGTFAKGLKTLIEPLLEKDRKDPGLGLLQALVNSEGLVPLKQLEAFEAEAERRGDRETITLIQSLKGSLRRGMADIFEPDDDDWDDEDEDEDDDDDEDEDFDVDALEAVKEAAEAIGQMSDAEFERFKRDMRGELPEAVLDDMRREAREVFGGSGSKPVGSASGGKRKSGAKAAPRGDVFEQLDLF